MSLTIQNQSYALSPLAHQCAENMIASYYDQLNWLTIGIVKLFNLGPNLEGFTEAYLSTKKDFEGFSRRSPLSTRPHQNDILESCNSEGFSRYYKRITEDLDYRTSTQEIFRCTISLLQDFGIWNSNFDISTTVYELPQIELIILPVESTSRIDSTES